ncbi:MAG: GatB/YqeY domain-containing protein, partial [Oceanicaulis sp.]|nr:GatB/YqeY domain-containing protein [Oceanicaulis sp.]
REQAEADIVRTYLPTPMDETEIEEAAETVVEELGATGLKDMGKCMGALKRRYTGRMDFSKAGETVKTLLQSRA